MSGDIRVLVVEDEPLSAQAHALYVGRVGGFVVAGVCATAGATRRALGLLPGAGAGLAVDVLLLDMNLPDGHGLDLVRAMRAAGRTTDVIAVTSARDLDLVRAAVSLGVVQYLLKPFTFPALRERLERYGAYRGQLAATPTAASQDEVDRALGTLRSPGATHLPKGLSQGSLDAVVGALRAAGTGSSAAELAGQVGLSRVTARRYLEHLAEAGVLRRSARYGGTGRPEVEYTLR